MSTFEPKPSEEARRDLLEASKEKADAPRQVSPSILSLYHGEKNPLKAIRARCLDCCCQQPSEVRKCVSVTCPSWPFRMGTNPFRQKRTLSPEQRQAMASRLSAAREATP